MSKKEINEYTIEEQLHFIAEAIENIHRELIVLKTFKIDRIMQRLSDLERKNTTVIKGEKKWKKE